MLPFPVYRGLISPASQGAGLVLWTPLHIGSTLKLWLKADTLALADGTAITTWSDSSGNGNDATGGATKPTFETNELNSMGVVRFPTPGGAHELSIGTMGLTGARAGTLIGLIKCQSDSGTNLGTWYDSGKTGSVGNHYPYSDGLIYDAFLSATRSSVGNPPALLSSWHLAMMKNASNVYSYFQNGVLYFSAGATTSGGGTHKIGKDVLNNYAWGGDIAELIFVDADLPGVDQLKFEGYVAERWGVRSVLDANHPYKATLPLYGAFGWTPASATTILWLDASDAATLSLSGSAVTQWDDKSGNGNHVSQSNSGNRPTYDTSTNTINGYAVVSFDGSDDFLSKSTLSGFPANNSTGVTTCVVARHRGSATFHALWDISNGTLTNTGAAMFAEGNSGANTQDLTARAGGFSNDATYSSTPYSTTQVDVWSSHNKTTLRQAFRNGAGGTANTATNTTNNFTNLRIGRLFEDVYPWSGDIAEVIMVAGQSVVSRRLLEGYLAWKYGIQGQLDAAHPFKNAAPIP